MDENLFMYFDEVDIGFQLREKSLLAFVDPRVAIKHKGAPEQYGAREGYFMQWLFLFDLGTTAGLRTQVAQLTGRPDAERLNRLASTAFFAQLVLALCVLVAGAAVSTLFPSLLGVRPDLHEEATAVVALLALGASLSLGARTFSVLLTAHQQIHIDNLIQLAMLVVRAALIVLLLAAGWKLYALAVAGLIVIIMGALLAVVRCRVTLPGLAIRFDWASWDTRAAASETMLCGSVCSILPPLSSITWIAPSLHASCRLSQ